MAAPFDAARFTGRELGNELQEVLERDDENVPRAETRARRRPKEHRLPAAEERDSDHPG